MTTEEIVISIIIEITGGLLVSFLFILLLLKYFRPNILISDKIILRKENYTDAAGQNLTRDKYSFKLLNRSIYHAFDAKFELSVMIPTNHTGANSNVQYKELSLRTSNMTHINRYRKPNDQQKDQFNLFAVIIHTNEDIETFLKATGSYIELKVTVRHGLTGLADTFTKQFGSESCIYKNCKFQFGAKMDVMPQNQTI